LNPTDFHFMDEYSLGIFVIFFFKLCFAEIKVTQVWNDIRVSTFHKKCVTILGFGFELV